MGVAEGHERDIQIQHVILKEESDCEQWKTINTKEKDA